MYRKEDVLAWNYTDFIANVGQWNVPPGTFSTVNEWAVFGHVTKKSRVLEIACTTGFSGRELAKLTGCSVFGIDISKASVEQAKKDAEYYAPHCKLEYQCIDLYDLPLTRKYTHIVLGAAIQFFTDQNKLIAIISQLLEDGGMLLVSPYYLTNCQLPENIIKDAQRVINIYPTNFDYYYAMNFYKDFEVLYHSRKNIVVESDDEINKYTNDTINRWIERNSITDDELIAVMRNRLLEIKQVCNNIHKYHSYSVMVLRYEKNVYPNRFVELF